MAMACGSHPAQSPGSQRARRLCGSALYDGHARGQGTSAGGRTTSREAAGATAGPRQLRARRRLGEDELASSGHLCTRAHTHTHTPWFTYLASTVSAFPPSVTPKLPHSVSWSRGNEVHRPGASG